MTRRPEAAALLAALADPDRGFDAITIGSSERAFSGQQFAPMAPVFEHYGVPVWLPELGGEVDPQLAAHDELMVLLGVLAKARGHRARIRARTAMLVQARDQGRYLGSRPPYGYRLVDAGPHPNRARPQGCATTAHGYRPGNRSHRHVDVPAAPAAHSVARITRALNDMKVPCPAAADRERNSAPDRDRLDPHLGPGGAQQPEAHRPPGLEPAAHRPRTD
ncbi:hypothetical protein ACU686_16315 [Yinghuangia aomiensis]